MSTPLKRIWVPDIHTPGVPRGQGAVVGYSQARVQYIVEAVLVLAAQRVEQAYGPREAGVVLEFIEEVRNG